MNVVYLGRLYICAALLAASFASAQSQPSIIGYPMSKAGFDAITTGPDGALWLAGFGIGRITTDGVFTSIPGPRYMATGCIVSGPDGALWFADWGNNAIGRITTAGSFTEYPIPTPVSAPEGITAGPDGALWFTERAGKIGRITTAGVITEFSLPTAGTLPWGVTTGPDGALWFTEAEVNTIGRITTAGVVTEYFTPTLSSQPTSITVGPDGALWFTETRVAQIGRITTDGDISEYAIPMQFFPDANGSQAITTGPDGALWFVGGDASGIARVTTAGTITEYPIPTAGAEPSGITTGPDGAMWFTEWFSKAVGRAAIFVPGLLLRITTPSALLPGTVNVSYSQQLVAGGGEPSYTWSVVSGSLPPGLSLSSAGVVTGMPTAAGTRTFTVQVTDINSSSAIASFSIAVAQPVCNYILNTGFGGGNQFGPIGPAGGEFFIRVNVNAGCPWAVSAAPSWSTVSPATGFGSGNVEFIAPPNYTANPMNGTLTIAGISMPVQEEAGLLPSSGFMPHVAAEGGWRTTFTLVNKGALAEDIRLGFSDNGGNPLALPIVFPQQPGPAPVTEASANQVIPGNGLSVLEASGPANVPYVQGSAQMTSSGAVDGFAIFHFDPSAQEAVVPIQQNSSGSILAFDNTNGVLTGVALELTSTPAGNILAVVLRDDTGALIGTGAESITVPSGGHISFVLSQQFPVTANIRGTVQFFAPCTPPPVGLPGGFVCGQISVLGIRYTPPGTLTTIPPLAKAGTTGGAMAHLAVNAGWQTTFVLVNTGSSSASATLNFFDDGGNPRPLPLVFLQKGTTTTAASATAGIAPGASLWMQSSGPLTDPLLTGSAQLTTDNSFISGYAILRYNPSGQEAVVPLEIRNAGTYLLAFDNTNATATGLAISAISTQSVSVSVILRDDTGRQIGTGSIPLAANGHYSQMLATLFPVTAGIRGTVEFDTPAGAQISVLGIRSPPALTFTTLPPLAK